MPTKKDILANTHFVIVASNDSRTRTKTSLGQTRKVAKDPHEFTTVFSKLADNNRLFSTLTDTTVFVLCLVVTYTTLHTPVIKTTIMMHLLL